MVGILFNVEQRRRRNTCRVCGARWPWVYVSTRGLCHDHSMQRLIEHNTQLHEHRGPHFERWRERCLAAFGVAVTDDVRDSSTASE